MTERTQYLQLATWSAADGRLANNIMWNKSGQTSQLSNLQSRTGVVLDSAQNSLKVTQRAAGANMSVDVKTGICVIQGTENALQGAYTALIDATENLVIAAAHATLARKDIVVGRVKDSTYSGASNSFTVEVVTGTAASSPAEPALPANSIKLAVVNVAAAASSITNANITDSRVYTSAAGAPIVCTSTTRPAFPVAWQFIYELDTHQYYTFHPANSTWQLQGYDSSMNTYSVALTASTTNPTLGTGGSIVGNWCYVDAKVVWVDIYAQFGTSGTNAGSGQYRISLPVAAHAGSVNQCALRGHVFDLTGTQYNVNGIIASGGSYFIMRGMAVNPEVSHNIPHAWAASDDIHISGIYGVA